jgi:hypothetical protein
MKNIRELLTASTAMLLGFTVAAQAAALAVGQYANTGTVATATSQCSAVGLAAGAANLSELTYPGAGKTGLALYVPASGSLQLCTGFAAVPSTGLTNFSSAAKCGIYTLNGNIPPQTVNFTFKSTVINAFSSIGVTTISIPASDTIGGGCVATVDTTAVFTGLK